MRKILIIIGLVLAIAGASAAAAANGGFFDGHKSAGWTWTDDHASAAPAPDGFSDGNG